MPARYLSARVAAAWVVAAWGVAARRARRIGAAVVLVAVLLMNGARHGQW